ncbi:MAG: DUF2905 domain-containing protein [Myxococcota bacterium]
MSLPPAGAHTFPAMESLGRSLVLLGVLLVAVGSLLYLAPSLPWLGRLPGDIRIERPGFRFYFPITTCILASAALTALLHLISRLR